METLAKEEKEITSPGKKDERPRVPGYILYWAAIDSRVQQQQQQQPQKATHKRTRARACLFHVSCQCFMSECAS